jgi:hypothetical protein
MNANNKLGEIEEVPAQEQKIKTLDVRLDVTEDDLEKRVMKSFDMAKSAGLELDVMFSYLTQPHGILKSQ